MARNKVLRQTYILLGMNVLFSAVCAYIGMLMNVNIPTVLYFVGFLGLSFAVQATRNSGMGIILLFALTGFLGFSVAKILNLYFVNNMGGVVVKALFGSAIIFFSLSAYALISGKNFSFLGGFLLVGFLVAFLASLGALFFHMPALQVVCSGAFLLIFSGYVLYDTSAIMRGEQDNYILATLNLFLNLFNIFISLLNILGSLNRN
ncbi:Bax inhibitor-1 family protein [Suttonella ornithocola]|uniref:Bax inhibitor-1 family protein n=1 Tax=Suttonella ornithocola TaxID=279832 RepID=UPI001FE8AD5C|nr:Bax inhibitor-1 family protein [Suttonella ornithocola]